VLDVEAGERNTFGGWSDVGTINAPTLNDGCVTLREHGVRNEIDRRQLKQPPRGTDDQAIREFHNHATGSYDD